MLKITTESGRVYFSDPDNRRFMRTGEGKAPGQWFENNEWISANRISNPGVGQHWRVEDIGSWMDPDLWLRTSRVVSVEEVGEVG